MKENHKRGTGSEEGVRVDPLFMFDGYSNGVPVDVLKDEIQKLCRGPL